MGLDLPDIRQVIHWGPPTDADSMCKRLDVLDVMGCAQKLFFINHHDISKSSHVQYSMKMCCENAIECRHSVLMNQCEQSPLLEHPKFLHLCCDVCMKLCKCLDCETIPPAAIYEYL